MLGKTYHGIRIGYIKNQLDRMIGGKFVTRRGKLSVCITHDPANSSVNNKNYKVYNVDTERGRFYAKAVNDYLALKSEYEQLLSEWNVNYNIPVPQYRFPINADPGPHSLTYTKFLQTKDYQNPAKNKKPFFYENNDKKEILRSRNEGHLLTVLDAKKIPYKIEPEIPINMEYNRTYNCRYPDAMGGLPEINRSFYLEVIGGMGLPGYKESNHTKFLDYEAAGYRDMKDFVTIYINDGWDEDYISTKIDAAIDVMCAGVGKADCGEVIL